MERVMPEDGLNQAERRMQSRFSFAVAVGCVESLVARLRMRLVPRYLVAASLIAAAALGASGWLMRVG